MTARKVLNQKRVVVSAIMRFYVNLSKSGETK